MLKDYELVLSNGVIVRWSGHDGREAMEDYNRWHKGGATVMKVVPEK